MENRTQKFCSILLFFFQRFDYGAAQKIESKMPHFKHRIRSICLYRHCNVLILVISLPESVIHKREKENFLLKLLELQTGSEVLTSNVLDTFSRKRFDLMPLCIFSICANNLTKPKINALNEIESCRPIFHGAAVHSSFLQKKRIHLSRYYWTMSDFSAHKLPVHTFV